MRFLHQFFASESEVSELQITEERLYELPEDQGVFYYIKVENPTDHPVACGNVIISMYDDKGEFLKDSKLSTKPFNAVIQPGDFMYLHASAGNAIFKEADIASYETVIDIDIEGIDTKNIKANNPYILVDVIMTVMVLRTDEA